jgi:hypothetical protein
VGAVRDLLVVPMRSLVCLSHPHRGLAWLSASSMKWASRWSCVQSVVELIRPFLRQLSRPASLARFSEEG